MAVLTELFNLLGLGIFLNYVCIGKKCCMCTEIILNVLVFFFSIYFFILKIIIE
jgi:hypothetical protein